jgi:hypothetical protein
MSLFFPPFGHRLKWNWFPGTTRPSDNLTYKRQCWVVGKETELGGRKLLFSGHGSYTKSFFELCQFMMATDINDTWLVHLQTYVKLWEEHQLRSITPIIHAGWHTVEAETLCEVILPMKICHAHFSKSPSWVPLVLNLGLHCHSNPCQQSQILK